MGFPHQKMSRRQQRQASTVLLILTTQEPTLETALGYLSPTVIMQSLRPGLCGRGQKGRVSESQSRNKSIILITSSLNIYKLFLFIVFTLFWVL